MCGCVCVEPIELDGDCIALYGRHASPHACIYTQPL